MLLPCSQSTIITVMRGIEPFRLKCSIFFPLLVLQVVLFSCTLCSGLETVHSKTTSTVIACSSSLATVASTRRNLARQVSHERSPQTDGPDRQRYIQFLLCVLNCCRCQDAVAHHQDDPAAGAAQNTGPHQEIQERGYPVSQPRGTVWLWPGVSVGWLVE